MFAPELPLDILDNIIDHLQDDVESLLRCCFVCRAFVIPSRKHLFAIVSLDCLGRSSSPSWKRLYDSLISNLKNVTYIQELWVKGTEHVIKEAMFIGLLALFARSASLRAFSIQISLKNGGYDGWHDLPITFRQPIGDIFCSPLLHTLCITFDRCACTFPVDLFINAPNVKRLALIGYYEYICPFPHDQPTADNLPAQRTGTILQPLEVLELGNIDTYKLLKFFDSPSSPFLLSSLRVVWVHRPGQSGVISGLWKILRRAAKSLETLVWLHPLDIEEGFGALGPVGLGQFESLRTLVVKVRYCHHEFQDMCCLLEKSVPNNLERLSLVVVNDFFYFLFDGLCVRDSTWADTMDPVLHRIFGHIERLRSIKVHVVLENTEEMVEMEQDVDAWRKTHFPMLDATGKLSVTLGPYESVDEVVKSLASA